MTTDIFPIELTKAIVCLSDENRRKIVSVLTEKSMAYTQIKNKLEFTNGNFNHHLIELIKAGLITRFLGTEIPGPYEKYYALSEFGKDFVNGIFNALSPSPAKEELVPEIQKRMRGETGTALGTGQLFEKWIAFAFTANNARNYEKQEMVVRAYGR